MKKYELTNKTVVGRYCIVRCDRSGVLAGTVEGVEGQTVHLTNARKLWYWHGACAVEQIATDGVDNQSQITVNVPDIIVTDAIQIIPASEAARKSIVEAKEWKR